MEYSIDLYVRNEAGLEGDAATVHGTTLSLSECGYIYLDQSTIASNVIHYVHVIVATSHCHCYFPLPISLRDGKGHRPLIKSTKLYKDTNTMECK